MTRTPKGADKDVHNGEGAHRRFVLGILQSFTPPAWLASDDRLHAPDWANGRYYVETARRLEAAKLDFMFFHDTLSVQRKRDGSFDTALKWAATAPAHDPLCLLPLLAYATEHIGLVGTASTTFNNPYQLARAFSTLDSLAEGRIGWNLVTSFEQEAARNFGLDQMPDRGDRYDSADEFLEVTKKLWDSWEPDAVIADLETDTYVDASKVHSVDHAGRFYRSQGPLNTMRSPQGMPVLAQAGASPRGRDFAAKNAELVFSIANGSIEEGKAFRDDIRARAERIGRDPDEIKVVFGTDITFRDEGWDPSEPVPVTDAQFGSQLAWWSASLDIDLSSYPMDEPFPVDTEPRPAGIRTMFDVLLARSRDGYTLREAIKSFTKSGAGLQGTPEEIAERIIEFVDGVGGDGIMITHEWAYNAAFLDTFTERLVPALRKAGVIRQDYVEGATFRESLFGV